MHWLYFAKRNERLTWILTMRTRDSTGYLMSDIVHIYTRIHILVYTELTFFLLQNMNRGKHGIVEPSKMHPLFASEVTISKIKIISDY